jgi:hypothetical protein
VPSVGFVGSAALVDTTSLTALSLALSLTVSHYSLQRLVLADGVSDVIVSLAALSSPSTIVLTATSLCRVNWPVASAMTSHGSAGLLFKDLFALVGSGAGLPSALHLCNSSGDSCIVTVLLGM